MYLQHSFQMYSPYTRQHLSYLLKCAHYEEDAEAARYYYELVRDPETWPEMRPYYVDHSQSCPNLTEKARSRASRTAAAEAALPGSEAVKGDEDRALQLEAVQFYRLIMEERYSTHADGDLMRRIREKSLPRQGGRKNRSKEYRPSPLAQVTIPQSRLVAGCLRGAL